MATSAITNSVKDATGVAVSGAKVRIRLMPCAGFKITDGQEVAQRCDTVTDASGNWTATLEQNINISPAGTYYEVEEFIPVTSGGSKKWQFLVGAVGQTLAAAAITAVPAITTSTYLTQAAADARYVQSPGSFAVVGNITDSRPADASAAGVLTTYARGDHKHSREIVRSTAAAIAALTGADSIAGHPYVTSDANNITGTGIFTPDTTSQPARADGMFVKNGVRFQPGFWNQPWGIVGYKEVTVNTTGVSTVVDITGAAITFTAAANRRYKITGQCLILATTATAQATMRIKNGATNINAGISSSMGSGELETVTVIGFHTPAAGATVIKLTLERQSGTGTLGTSIDQANRPDFILIEDVGPNGAPA